MPTSVDRFYAVIQICQNLATMQNNMRQNVQIIQKSKLPLAKTEKAFQDLGAAFQKRLKMNSDVIAALGKEFTEAATGMGVDLGHMAELQALLEKHAGNLRHAKLGKGADRDTLVADVLAGVPAAILAF